MSGSLVLQSSRDQHQPFLHSMSSIVFFNAVLHYDWDMAADQVDHKKLTDCLASVGRTVAGSIAAPTKGAGITCYSAPSAPRDMRGGVLVQILDRKFDYKWQLDQ